MKSKTSGTIRGASQLHDRVETSHGRKPNNYHAVLSRYGIRSFKQLGKRLDQLPIRVRRKVPWMLQHAHKKSAVPILLRLLADPRLQGNAIGPLESHGSTQAVRGVIRILQSTNNPQIREDTVQSLSSMFHPPAHDALMTIASDVNEPVFVRTHAIEGIGNLYVSASPRTRPFKDAEQLVMRLLKDDAAPIRFWACFAAGSMRSKRALPLLRKLARNDRAICPGWWRISEEANDAIHCVETGRWPDTVYRRYPSRRIRWQC